MNTIPHLHDMDSCERDAYGDPARFAALVRERFPYMDMRRRVEVVGDYQRLQQDARDRQARRVRDARIDAAQRVASWAIFVGFVVYEIAK